MQGKKHTHQQHQQTRGRIISHAAELPLARCVHAGPPVATAPLMKQRRAAAVENRADWGGALSLALPRRVDN